MTRIKAEELLDAVFEIEEDLELTPGMVVKVLLREYEDPGDPVANFFSRLIAAKLSRIHSRVA